MTIELLLTWLLLGAVFWAIPLGLIISDPIVSVRERILWVFATIFVSWFAWLLFLWIAPVFPRANRFREQNRYKES